MGIIYRLDFSDGRSYVGITRATVQRRFHQHRRKAKKARSILYEAWRRLGEPIITVLAEVPEASLLSEEVRLIYEMRTQFPEGYNTTPGGDIAPTLNPLVARKISESRKGIIFSAEHIMNLSLSHRGLPSSNRGKPIKQEQKTKLVAAWSKRRLVPESEQTHRRKSAASKRPHKAETREKIRIIRLAWWAAKRAADAAAV